MKRWPLNKSYFWETAPFFRILLPFASGIVCYDRARSSSLPGSYALWASFIALLLCLLLLWVNKNKAMLHAGLSALLVIFMLLLGYSASYFNDIKNDPSWFGSKVDSGNTCLVRLTDDPVEKERTWKLTVSVLDNIANGNVAPTSGKAFLYCFKEEAAIPFHKGDTILIPGNWQPIKNAGNPFEFDYAANCRRNNILYQQFCFANDIQLFAAHAYIQTSLIDKVHESCMRQLTIYLPDLKTKGLIQAMLLGDEVNLDSELRQSYSETGIVHIIAISGGNVAIFFLVISFLLRWLKNRKHLWVKYAIALPMVWFYVVMAGAPPSAVRAAVMFSLFAGGIMLQKNNNNVNNLLATAFLLLCAQPMWLFSLGFQLSFVAVLSLLIFYAPVYKWFLPKNTLTKGLWSAIAASISAEILVAPLVIYYFHTFPLLFLVANVLAYVFMSVVLYMSMAIIGLSFIPFIAKILGSITVLIVTFFNKIVEWLQGCNPYSFHMLMLTGVELILLYIILSGILLFLMKKQKPALFTGLIAACLLLISFSASEWTMLHQRRLVVYNTGKANYIELIEGDHYSIICQDTGSQKKTNYAIKPAHIGWHAWRQDSSATPYEIMNINGKSLLILNQRVDTGLRFHVDYLVINCEGRLTVEHLQRVFTPEIIIAGNSYSVNQQDNLLRNCVNNAIGSHATRAQGAYVAE
jgi:competence protein ComEC